MADTTRIPDVMLERYLAGDLRPEQRSRIEEAVRSTPAVAARLQEITTERNAFLVASPPAAAAHRIATRLVVEAKPRSRWQIWYLLPPVGVAAALAFGVMYQKALGPQTIASAPAVVSDEKYELAPKPSTWATPPADPQAVAVAPEPVEPQVNGMAPMADKAPAVSALRAEPRPAGKLSESRRAEVDERALDRADDAELARKVKQVEAKSAKKDAPRGEGAGFGVVADGSRDAPSGGAGGIGGKGYAQPPADASAMATGSVARNEEKSKAAPEAEAVGESALGRSRSSGPVAPAKPADESAKKPAPPPPAPVSVATPAAPAAQAAPSPAPRESPAKSERMKEDDADLAPTAVKAVITLTRQTGGRAVPIAQKDLVAAGTTLVAGTTFPSGVLTVIGVRPDGKAQVYGQVTLNGAPASITFKVRPATMRLSEVVFVSVTNDPVKLDSAVGPNRDAQRLPLRLDVPGTQRRFVMTVSASGD